MMRVLGRDVLHMWYGLTIEQRERTLLGIVIGLSVSFMAFMLSLSYFIARAANYCFS